MTNRLSGVQIPVDDNQRDIAFAYKDMTTLLAYNASNVLQYIGKAPSGTDSSTNGWQIKKLAYDVNYNLSNVLFASGTIQYDKTWTGRGSYFYL